jgi:FkbM family methyltransferase
MTRPGPHETTLQKIGRKLGVTLTRTEQLGAHVQARYLKRLFPLLGVDLVLDVGGNAGQFAHFIRHKVGYRGKLVTFEPLPDLAAELQRKAERDPNWQVVNAGVGAEAGTLEFNVMESSLLSSFLPPSEAETARLAKINKVEAVISVDVVTIDGFLAENYRDCRNVYLKLDVQGFEEQCLNGAMGSRDRIAALQAELSVTPLYAGIPKYYELMRKIEEMGYRLSLAPPHNAAVFPEILDFDCHFVSIARLKELGVLQDGPGQDG